MNKIKTQAEESNSNSKFKEIDLNNIFMVSIQDNGIGIKLES